jgi:hypothetical protein
LSKWQIHVWNGLLIEFLDRRVLDDADDLYPFVVIGGQAPLERIASGPVLPCCRFVDDSDERRFARIAIRKDAAAKQAMTPLKRSRRSAYAR